MSLAITVQVDDQISPAIRVLAGKMQNLTPVHRSIGIGLVALAKRAFDEPALRPTPWPAKHDGTVATLRRSSTLWRSLRVIQAGPTGVTIGSDRPYAAIHQLGGQTKPHPITARRARSLYFQLGAKSIHAKSVQHPGSRIPARPFFPVTPNGDLTAAARQTIGQVLAAYLRR
jgi:phage gpG-like protein